MIRCCVALGLAAFLLGAGEPPPVESLRAAADGFDLRLAQANLARAGAASLPAMEKMTGEHDAKLDVRLKETVGLMLIVSTPWEEVQKCPALLAACKEEFDKGRVGAKIFVGIQTYNDREHEARDPRLPPLPPTPTRVAQHILMDRHGYAIPAVMELSKDSSPAARMYAMETLLWLNAVAQKPTLDRLLEDIASVPLPNNGSLGRIGALLADRTKTSSIFSHAAFEHASDEAEQYLLEIDWLARGEKAEGLNMLNRLRQEAKTLESPTWDDYWKRAAPILREAWTPPAK